jgi:hypothetical protein
MYHEGLRHLATWWRDNGVKGVQERDLALALAVLPAKEKSHPFLDWFERNGPAGLWQVQVLRKAAQACSGGLMDQIRELPDERWEWGVKQVLPHLALEDIANQCTDEPPTIFHWMMVRDGLTVEEILSIGVLQGVRPRTTCLKWYEEHKGESGEGWPIPLFETLAAQVFNGKLLDTIEALDSSDAGAARGLELLREILKAPPSCCSSSAPPKKRNCCG